METVKILCVPVQGCEDVEEENHENKIGLKRDSPLSGGDLFVPKSKPIAKSAPQRYVTRGEIFGLRVPG